MTEVEALTTLLADARRSAVDAAAVGKIDALQSRLSGPVRVALVGRANAGKSTLLNALIGERLAATDASECTRFVTAFEHAESYRASSAGRELGFTRAEDGPLDIRVEGLNAAADSLVVGWPSRRLEHMTLIDTPGLDALAPRGGDPLEQTDFADAYLYLMRNVHRADVRFLESFVAAGAQLGSPVNSLAILSRADEIGGGRLDGLESARRIAARDGADPRLRALASAVLPVVGLLAESAATLRENEARALEELARTDDQTRAMLLLSVDDFCDTSLSPVTAEIRVALLRRFALFGVRTAIAAYRDGRWSNGTALAR
ncbi:MAG TPA: dynamin family protein, partial [Planctomycetota bacterium]|nr:dynamin family protein [Planctomycetota bacterium]